MSTIRTTAFSFDRKDVAITLLLVGLLSGCAEDLAVPDVYDAPFSLYGTLNPLRHVQSIRVYETENLPMLGSPEPLDVDVTSMDLGTGERWTWKDSVLVEPNGQVGHVFTARFQPQQGHAYRVEVVRRSDGATSYADVRIPSSATVRFDERESPLIHAFVEGDDIRLLNPEIVYSVRGLSLDAPLHRYAFSYQGRERKVDGVWQVTFNLLSDYTDIHHHYPYRGIPCDDIRLIDANVNLLIGDVAWDPPNGVFDVNVVSQPQTMSNVHNGLGFVGGGFNISRAPNLSQEAVELGCFEY